jgi:hypothetical protein
MSNFTYSSEEELKKYARERGLRTPSTEAISNPEVPLPVEQDASTPAEIPEEFKGQYVAEMVKRYGSLGYVPTLEEYRYYDEFMRKKKLSMWKEVTDAVGHATSDLAGGAWELTKDVATLKVPKVIGSGIEGAAVGTKNWLYMYEQAKYDHNSWLSKLLFDNHSTIEDSYLSFQEALKVQQMIHKDQNEGVIVPPKIEIGGMELDLTNPAVVQAVSYVADPSWLIPNLGVESAIAKGLKGASSAIGLGENLSKASAFALKKTSEAFGKIADVSETVTAKISGFDKGVSEALSNMTGHDHSITYGGRIMGNEGLVRSAENALGVDSVKIPMWAKLSGTWGAAKVIGGISRAAELGAKLATEESKIVGMSLSERIAAESTSAPIRKVATFWSQTASPFVDWASQSTKVGLHSSMYGGAFGFAFGGEEGLYHGLGTGFVIGSAFNQIGVLHNTVTGGDAVRDTVKHFLWATSHYDFNNQEGLMRLMENVNREGGTKGQLSLMSQIAASERLLKDDKILILTEKKIKEMSTSAEWDSYERGLLANPDFGGVTFMKNKNNESIILINADRAAKSAVSEETFHGLLLTKRYGKAFSKEAIDMLVGTEDRAGALYRMPKEKAVSLLEQFRDQYFNLDKETAGHQPEAMSQNLKKFNEAIERFKGGDKPTEIAGFFEEFLASYWNRFVEEKPLDYLLKGGDLGIVRNAIESAKDTYRNIMSKDLQEAGVQLVKGETPDMFLIDQNTKQRVRIPMLERLMKHYVKELNKGMFDGWAINNKKYADTDMLLNSDFDHLLRKDIESGSPTPMSAAEMDKQMDARLSGLVDELIALPKGSRGTSIEVLNTSGERVAQFQRAKKKKTKKEKEPETVVASEAIDINKERGWFLQHRKKLAQTGIVSEDLSSLGPTKGKRPRIVERKTGTGRWSLERSGEFWESVWQGNPRIRITGLATNSELSLFERYLGPHVASRLRELNLIIERSRAGRVEDISNILRSTVVTVEKTTDEGREQGIFIEQRRFVPLELNIAFKATPKGKPNADGIQKFKVSDARLLTTVMDWDAYLRREDFFFNKINDGEINYRTIRNLFGTQQNLRESVKALLSNYSLGNHAEAGLKIFNRGKGGVRDAALKRDIVNAVLGFHPTKEMMKRKKYANRPLEAQLRDELPATFNVIKDFRVDRMSKIRAEEGEGFRYDHNEAYKRSQANFSPAVTNRDNNGHIIPAGTNSIIRETVYRNKEGEHIAVYPLRTPTSEIQIRGGKEQVFDYVDGDLASNMEAVIPSLRGSQYTSRNGWLHFTPDVYEAGFFEDKKMRVGYIDTQSHLTLSDIPFGSDLRSSIDKVALRIADTSGEPFQKVLEDLLRIRDGENNRVFDTYKKDIDEVSSDLPTLDEWLFTPNGKRVLSKYKIQSVEYMNLNPISGHEYSTVAIMDSGRFIENRQVKGLDDFMFQPSKTIADKYKEQVAKAGTNELSGLLKYKIDEKGNVVERSKHELITEKFIDDEVRLNKMLVTDALDYLKKEKVFTQETYKRFKDIMTPKVVNLLKTKFPKAPLHILDKIAKYSMTGYVEYVASLNVQNKLISPFGRETYIPKVSMNADSALIENANKYGITPKALEETGLISLGHWAEMSEAEYMTLTNYKNWDSLIKKVEAGKLEEANTRIKEQEANEKRRLSKEERTLIREPLLDKAAIKTEAIQRVLRENNGLSGLIGDMAERQRQLVFLVDSTIFGNGRVGNDNLTVSTKAKNNIMKAFMERNIEFAKTLIKSERGYARKEMLDVVNAYENILASRVDVSAEAGEAYAIYKRQEREVRNIISDDAKQRIMDFLTAYHIKDINPDVLEKVRAKLYDESSKGFVELGTPEAIARSVELYAFFDSNGKDTVAKIRESIKRNYIESLNLLEKEGFYGVRWNSLDLSKTAFKVSINETTNLNASRAWNFDGTNFTVIEKTGLTLVNDKKVEANATNLKRANLVMLDSEGNVLLRREYSLLNEKGNERPQSFVDEQTDLFLQESTQIVRRKALAGEVPAHQLIEGPYQEVKGNMKSLILEIAKQTRGTSVVPSERYRLYRNGDYFVAHEIQNNELGFDASARIKQLETQLEVGKANAKRPLGDIEKESLKTRLKKIQEDLDSNKFDNVDRIEQLEREAENIKATLAKGYKSTDKLDKKVDLTTDEKLKIREEITRLQKFRHSDLGFSFTIDKNYGVKIDQWSFPSIKERNRILSEIGINRNRNSDVGFERFAEDSFKKFNQFLSGERLQQRNRLASILAEGNHADSVIPQIKNLMAQLNELEKKQRLFFKGEKNRVNNEQRLNGKKPLEEKAIVEQIKKDLEFLEDAADEAEAKHLAAAQQLFEMKILEKMPNFTPERIEELLYRVAAKSRELDLNQYMMAAPKDGNIVAMVSELQKSFTENGNRFALINDRYLKLHDGFYGKDEDISLIRDRVAFLSRRYLQAKGIKLTADREFILSAKLHDFDVVSKYDYNKLRTYRPQGKGVVYEEPSFLADFDNVLGKGHEEHRSIKDYSEAFKARLVQLKEYYDVGLKQGDISIKNILGIELGQANTDFSITHTLRNRITKSNLGDEAFAWANDPKNRAKVKQLDEDIISGRIDHNEAVQIMKDEQLLSTIGKDGVELKKTVEALSDTIEKIGIVANRLNLARNKITLVDENANNPYWQVTYDGENKMRKFRADIPKDIPNIEKELDRLRSTKKALQERYERILKRAGDDKAPLEFKRLVAEYRHIDYENSIAKKNMKQDRAQFRELEKLRKANIVKLFKQYDDFAKNLGIKGVTNSRIEINVADPQTQLIAYSFPEITRDLFQSSWRQYDLSTSSVAGSANAGVVTGRDPLPSTEFRGGNGVKNFILTEARNNRRAVYLADYIHFAHAKKAFHEKNPSLPMSAADANLIQFFFKNEVNQGVLKRKIDQVPEEQMKQQEAVNNGILDNLKNNTERERFIRSFVLDALDLISNNVGIREKALKKLKQMSDEEFAAWKEKNPVDVDKSLETIEVIEQAMYLVKNGRIPVGNKGEAYNYRDSVHTTLSKDDIGKLYAYAEKKFGLDKVKDDNSREKIRGVVEEYVQKQIDQGIVETTPREVRQILARKKSPFITRSDIGHIPIDTLVRMQGFMDIWKQEVAKHSEDSLFGIERNYGIKEMYENLPPQQRFNLDMPTINNLMKDNERLNIQSAREIKKRYKQQNKAILDESSVDQFHYGEHDDLVRDEWSRINHILEQAMKTSASIAKYKKDAMSFISNRPMALDNLLSLEDNLRISDVVRKKDGSLSIDWDNPNKPNFRDTIDGRYFIQRVMQGKEARYNIFFKGEKFMTPSGKEFHTIPTRRFAQTDNLTEAQVMIRFFEDDVVRAKRTADMISGGKGKFDPYRVGEEMLPVLNPKGSLLANWGNLDLFSEQVLNLYMENKGKPFFRQLMADKLEGIGQYGEMAYLKWEVNGEKNERSMVITPKQRGIISKHFTLGVNKNGNEVWTRKKVVSEEPALKEGEDSTTAATATRSEDAPADSPEQKTISDATTFDVVQTSTISQDKPYEDWAIIRNRLKYTIIKLDTDNKSIFRIFNPASVFLAETYNEVEAVEEILKQEMKKYE